MLPYYIVQVEHVVQPARVPPTPTTIRTIMARRTLIPHTSLTPSTTHINGTSRPSIIIIIIITHVEKNDCSVCHGCAGRAGWTGWVKYSGGAGGLGCSGCGGRTDFDTDADSEGRS